MIIANPISNDPLTLRIVNRLTRAIADDTLRKKMDLEDEFEQTMQEAEDKTAKAEARTKRAEAKAAKYKQELEDKDKALEDKDKELAALKALLETLKPK